MVGYRFILWLEELITGKDQSKNKSRGQTENSGHVDSEVKT